MKDVNFKISLAAARVNAEMSQKAVAKILGVANNTIVAWEKGHRCPSASQFLTLCEIYKCPSDIIKMSSD